MTVTEIAKKIDHSVLAPDATSEDVRQGCTVARRFEVASVCLKPCHVELGRELLAGSGVALGTVIGFPHGGSTRASKVFEARDAVGNGATELDMVIDIGAMKEGNVGYVREEVLQVVQACPTALIKVILETAYLTDAEIVAAARAAEGAGAHFVKTSTGFASRGATIADVALMRGAVGPRVRVKASGGIKTMDTLLAMIGAGADRVGTSATLALLEPLL